MTTGLHCLCRECARSAIEPLTSSRLVFQLLQPLLAPRRVEVFYAVPVSIKLQPIGRPVLVAQGSISACLVHPRETFQAAVRRRSYALIVAHNHPSGDPTPSDEDRALTRRLVAAGDILGIKILDHVIVGKGEWFSFADAGLLTTGALS